MTIMPIDVHQEELLTLSQAARAVRPRGAKPLAPSTIWRWHKHGIKGVRLETVVIGGKRHTSREALTRFTAATTQACEPVTPASVPDERPDDVRQRLLKAGLLAD